MVKRYTKLLVSSVFLAIALANPAKASNEKVTMIAYPPGDDFYFTIEQAARKQATESGVDLTVQKLPSYEMSAQIAVLNAAIASKPDAIIVSPLDPNGLQAALDRAKELGIKVILYDSATRDLSVAATFVSADITEEGRNAAREFKRLTQGKAGSVFYQGTAPAVTFFNSLQTGWKEVIGAESAYKQLPVNYSDFEPAKSASQMQAVLVSTPDLIGGFAGIFLDQQGNIPAIERAGKAGQLTIIGVDGAPENVQRLRDGKLAALVSVKAADYGTEAVKAAVAAVAGQSLPQQTVIGQCVLTAKNLSDPENAKCLYELDKK